MHVLSLVAGERLSLLARIAPVPYRLRLRSHQDNGELRRGHVLDQRRGARAARTGRGAAPCRKAGGVCYSGSFFVPRLSLIFRLSSTR